MKRLLRNFLPHSPIYYQPLEQELTPLLKYFHGSVLNAGCGNRDIAAFLMTHAKVNKVDNSDIQSSIPGAIICALTRIPLPDASYDTIRCNAVLEHVPDTDRVMSELNRLLRIGGYLIVSVPFLQPYHPTPGDFRRFTIEGVRALAGTKFLVEELLPVHSMAQTVGAILWNCLRERSSILVRAMLFLPILAWTRLSANTDPRIKLNANSYQAVLKKIA